MSMTLSLVEDTQAPPETWPSYVALDQWAHFKSIDTTLERLKHTPLVYAEPEPSSSRLHDAEEEEGEEEHEDEYINEDEEDEYEDEDDAEEESSSDSEREDECDDYEQTDAASDSGNDEKSENIPTHELSFTTTASTVFEVQLDEPEETFAAGWSTASSESEESECEDEDDDIIYLGSKPAPSALSVVAGEEEESETLDFGARFLFAELAGAASSHASPKSARLPSATSESSRLQTAKNGVARPSGSNIECDDQAPSTLVDVTNVVAATEKHGIAVSGENDDVHPGKEVASPDVKRFAPKGIDPWATVRLPSPSSPIDFSKYRPTSSLPPSPTPAETGRLTTAKRRRQSDSTSGEDTGDDDDDDDDDYVPSRKLPARRTYKRDSTAGSSRDHGQRRRAKRPRIKVEEAEDVDRAQAAGGNDKPFSLNVVQCRWQGCGEDVERLHIWHHIKQKHLATRRGEKNSEKTAQVECLWPHGSGPHTLQHDSMPQHIHSKIGTAYLCRCFCWTTKKNIKTRAKTLQDIRAGILRVDNSGNKDKKEAEGTKTLQDACAGVQGDKTSQNNCQKKAEREMVWGPCLVLYSQLWRLNSHIKTMHKGENHEQTYQSAMLLD